MTDCIDTDEAVTLNELFGADVIERAKHVGSCVRCADELDHTRSIAAALCQAVPDHAMMEAVMPALRASRKRASRQGLLTSLVFLVASATAILALTIATGTTTTVTSPFGLLATLATGIVAAVSSRKREHAATRTMAAG